MQHKLNKYIDESFKKVNIVKPYSQHILVSSIYLCFAGWLGVELTSNEKSSSFKQWLNTEILKIIEVNDKNFEGAISTLSEYIPNDMLEILTSTNIFNDINRKHQEYVDLFEAFIHLLAEADKAISTPKSINKLCTLILNPQYGCLYDGVAGIGSTMLCAHDHALRHNGNLTVLGQEIDLTSYSILAVRAYMHGVGTSNIHKGDTLVNPLNFSKDTGDLKKFEFSIMFPPVGQSWNHIRSKAINNRHHQFLEIPPTSSSEWLFVQQMCVSLHETYGKGIIGVSSGALFNRVFSKVREELIQSGVIESIISLPGGILPFTMVPLCLIVINKATRKNHNILMINAAELLGDIRRVRGQSILTDENITEILKIYNERNSTEASRLVSLNELVDGILLPEKYINSSFIESSPFGKLQIVEKGFIPSKWITLKEIGNFYRGVNISNYFEESEDGNYSIINYQDIQDGELNIYTIKQYRLKEARSKKGLVGKYRVSLRINTDKYYSRFVKHYIDSPIGQYFIESRQIGSSIITLNIKDLESIPIPLLPLSQQIEFCNQFEDGATRIYKQIELLQQQLNNLKWDFYEKIGLNAVIERMDNENE